jgi:MFS family permease
MSRNDGSTRALVIAAVLAFAAFGAFWGAWGASIPRVRAQAGLDDSQLGVALLFVAAGALPAMLCTGKAIDRWGLRVAALTIASLGASGAIVALAGQSLVSLSVALTLVGVTSGASDVAMNTVAGRAERDASRPVITRAHAVFSTFVVIASLGTGLLAGIGAPLVTPFAVVAVTAFVAAAVMFRTLPTRRATRRGPTPHSSPSTNLQHPASFGHATQLRTRTPPRMSLIGFGLLGALAFASENAHQSWSAIFITDALGTDVALGSLAPAVFAAAVATTRFAAGGIGAAHARVVLATGAATAAAGALIVSTAPNLTLSMVGLITAAAGTAVLFPTILGVISARVEETHRGRATSWVTTLAYLGFLLSPVYVGFWSGAAGIRGAMLAVAALGAVRLLLTPMVKPTPSGMRTSQRHDSSTGTRHDVTQGRRV